MDSITVTENDLRAIARKIDRLMDVDARFQYTAGRVPFVMVEFGRNYIHHFRMDLLKFDNGGYQRMLGSTSRSPYSYKVTSLHVKRIRLLDSGDFAVYMYLNYAGGGVWQPQWGYTRELLGLGRVGRKLNLTDGEMNGAYLDCQDMMSAMSDVLRTPHGLACGPMQSPAKTMEAAGLNIES